MLGWHYQACFVLGVITMINHCRSKCVDGVGTYITQLGILFSFVAHLYASIDDIHHFELRSITNGLSSYVVKVRFAYALSSSYPTSWDYTEYVAKGGGGACRKVLDHYKLCNILNHPLMNVLLHRVP